jgi:hypothetical protein
MNTLLTDFSAAELLSLMSAVQKRKIEYLQILEEDKAKQRPFYSDHIQEFERCQTLYTQFALALNSIAGRDREYSVPKQFSLFDSMAAINRPQI